MELDDFFTLGSGAVEYDFTNDVFDKEKNEGYINCCNQMERYFIYKCCGKGRISTANREKYKYLKEAYDFADNANDLYDLIDPDSESRLLQKIYKELWKGYLECCTDSLGVVHGDTLNSVQTTLSEQVKKGGFYTLLQNWLETGIEDEGSKEFIKVYHTLGNFMPVPIGCNAPRGTGLTKDYLDLALNIIFNFFSKGENNLDKIVGEKNKEKYEKWLMKFGSWAIFVEKNYLQDFVSYMYVSGKETYGKPKELWQGHFAGEVLPKGNEIIQFYQNASSWILARGNRMLLALRKR